MLKNLRVSEYIIDISSGIPKLPFFGRIAVRILRESEFRTSAEFWLVALAGWLAGWLGG